MIYTDYFDRPLAVGDEIIYPESSGSSRACFGRYPIVKIIPLITHRNDPAMLMREDQEHATYATPYGPRFDPAKCFVIQVMRKPSYGPARKYSIRFTDNVIKVP